MTMTGYIHGNSLLHENAYLSDLELAKHRPYPSVDPMAQIQVVDDKEVQQHVNIPCYLEYDSPYHPHTLLGYQPSDHSNHKLIYQCQTCGAKRVYGLVGIKGSTTEDEE